MRGKGGSQSMRDNHHLHAGKERPNAKRVADKNYKNKDMTL